MHLISCARCGRIHPYGQCPIPVTKNYRGRTKSKNRVQKFRSTARWQHKREQILERDRHLCRMCLDEGHINGKNLQVHHIIPIRKNEDLILEDDNLITLCPMHHQLVEGKKKYISYLYRLAKTPPGI